MQLGKKLVSYFIRTILTIYFNCRHSQLLTLLLMVELKWACLEGWLYALELKPYWYYFFVLFIYLFICKIYQTNILTA